MNLTNKDTGKTVATQYGLFAESIITQGHPILEYTGVIYTHSKFNKEAKKDATLNHYVVEYDNGNYMLTARHSGSKARFVNHSCEPNTYLAEYICNGMPKILIVSKRRINCNEELTFDYRWKEKESQARNKCYCGTSTCRGYLQTKETKAKRKANAMENWLENVNPTTKQQLNTAEADGPAVSASHQEDEEVLEANEPQEDNQIRIDGQPREAEQRNKRKLPLIGIDKEREEAEPPKARMKEIWKRSASETDEDVAYSTAKRARHNPHNDNKPP
jgi:hypothetical protein